MKKKNGYLIGLLAVLLGIGIVSTDMVSEVSAMGSKKSQAPSPVIPPAWSQILDATNGDTTAGREGCDSARFSCVFNDTAVLDNETGLVWDRDPTAGLATETGIDSWSIAANKCIRKFVGGRKGWRLSSVHELTTLIDMAIPANDIRLPAGHPFLNIGNDFYWTATTWAEDTNRAWVVRFLGGGVPTDDKAMARPFWCVRGASPGPAVY